MQTARQELGRVSEQTGVAAGQLQAMQSAARASGQELGDLSEAVESMRGNESVIAAYNDQLRAFGAEVGPDAVDAANAWKAAVNELHVAIEGLTLQALPSLGGLLHSFTLGAGTALAALATGVELTFAAIVDQAGASLRALAETAALVARAATGDMGAIGQIASGNIPVLTQGATAIGIGSQILDSMAMAGAQQAWAQESAFQGVGAAAPFVPSSGSSGGSRGGGGGRGAAASGSGISVSSVGGDVSVAPGSVAWSSSGPRTFEWGDDKIRDAAEVLAKEIADEADTRKANNLAAASGGLDAASRIMSGNLGGVAALAGPVGAVVGQAIDTLSMLGREGAAGIADNIRESVYAILQGLKELPKLLTEEVPALISELIPAMTEALIEAMPALVVAQYEAVYRAGVALFRVLFMELPGMLVEAIVEGVKRAWEAIKGFFKDPLGVSDGIDWKKTATNILRVGAGVATLGLSEIGLSAYRGADNAMGGSLPGYSRGSRAARSTAPASSARTTAAMGGGGVTINVQNMVGGREGTRQLMREIRIATGSRGLGEV
jgi:hypothetical protein